MVSGNGVCHVLHQDGLTGLGLCHDKCALAFTDRCEEVHDTRAEVGGAGIAAECVFLVGEERREVLERNAVTHFLRTAPVNLVNACQGEVFLSVVRRTHMALYHVASLQAVALHLLHAYIHIIG